MSSIDILWQNVKDYLKSLPITAKNNKKIQQLNIFIKTVKVYQNGNDFYLLVHNKIVESQLKRSDFFNLIVTAFNECTRSQCNVLIMLNKDFSLSKLNKSSIKESLKEQNFQSHNIKQEHKTLPNTSESFIQEPPKKISKKSNTLYSNNNLVSKTTNNTSFAQTYEKNNQGVINEDINYSHLTTHFDNIESLPLVPNDLITHINNNVSESIESNKILNSTKKISPELNQTNSLENCFQNDTKFIGSFRTLNDSEITENRYYKADSIDITKRFDNFVEGPTNKNLCENGKLISQMPGNSDRNPFFVYGESGLGKTHILFAIGNAILKQNPNKKVMYVNMSTWLTDYHMALSSYYDQSKNKTTESLIEFRTLYRNLDVLLIDDMQELVKRETKNFTISHELINLMHDINNNYKKCQLIFASNIHPQTMVNVEGRLRSRLLSGVCIKVEPPDYDTRRKIVELKAREMKLNLDSSSIDFIAYKMQTNVRTLEGHIKTLGALCPDRNQIITVHMVKDILHDALAGKEKLLTVDNIKKTVADYYRITVKEIDSSARPSSIALPRMMAMYLARELTNKSFPHLGKEFGGKDHSTVMNAKKRISKLIETDQKLREDYNNLKLQLI